MTLKGLRENALIVANSTVNRLTDTMNSRTPLFEKGRGEFSTPRFVLLTALSCQLGSWLPLASAANPQVLSKGHVLRSDEMSC